MAFPWMRADTPGFRSSGHYAPYILSTEVPAPDTYLPDWLLARTLAHGLRVLTLDVGLLGDKSMAESFGRRCTAAGVDLLGSVSLDLCGGDEQWKLGSTDEDSAWFDPERAGPLHTGWIGSSERSIALEAMRRARAAGISVLSLVHGHPDRGHRYTRTIPVDEYVDRMTRNVATLVPQAETHGLVLALEPHMDFRCAEFVQVVTAVNTSHLGLVMDFADPLSVNEDPLVAVREAAPHVVGVHLRDMRVQALTEIATGAFFHTPIGDGSVPIGEMLQVLHEECPNGTSLPCCFKVVTRPEHDVEAWLTASVARVRENHAPYWSD